MANEGILRCRLVKPGEGKVTAGERRYAISPGLGVGIPKSRDEMGDGSEEFYTAQSGRCADLP